jgi:hypothetical protein
MSVLPSRHHSADLSRDSRAIDQSLAQSGGASESRSISALQKMSQMISNEINLLYRLMNSIRKASKDLHHLKAADSFKFLDDEGNNLEPTLQESSLRLLQDYCHPDISEGLLARLASSMVARHKRILYRRSRYGSTPLREVTPATKPDITPTVHERSTEILGTENDTLGPNAATTSIVLNQSQARSIAPTATTLNPEKYRKVSTPSHVSKPKTIDLSKHDSLNFPEPPRVKAIKKYKSYEQTRRQELSVRLSALSDRPDHGASDDDEAEAVEAEIQNDLVRFWRSLNNGSVEVMCPICFYAIPHTVILDVKSWR